MRWTDAGLDRLEETVRAMGGTAGQVAVLAAQVDAFRDSLEMHGGMVRDAMVRQEEQAVERFDRMFEKLSTIETQARLTNGRITSLEGGVIAANAVRVEREARAEADRVERESRVEADRVGVAEELARHGWVKPSLFGVVLLVLAKGLEALWPV